MLFFVTIVDNVTSCAFFVTDIAAKKVQYRIKLALSLLEATKSSIIEDTMMIFIKTFNISLVDSYIDV